MTRRDPRPEPVLVHSPNEATSDIEPNDLDLLDPWAIDDRYAAANGGGPRISIPPCSRADRWTRAKSTGPSMRSFEVGSLAWRKNSWQLPGVCQQSILVSAVAPEAAAAHLREIGPS